MKKQKRNISGLATEQPSLYNHIEKKPILENLLGINNEDQKVAIAVRKAIKQIALLCEHTVKVIEGGHKIFYIGAGTSGRLGIVDASECPPTFGTDPSTVVGVIAGGHAAMFRSAEHVEDNPDVGFPDLLNNGLSNDDIVIGISASGGPPYVVQALKKCKEIGIKTACIVSNPNSEMAKYSDFSIEVSLGPEYITASSRMKSGTAQKLILNMISTCTFAKNGGVKGNDMARMIASNDKLVERGAIKLMAKKDISYEEAVKLIEENGNKMDGLLE